MEFASLFHHMLIPPAQVSHIVSYTLWYLNIGQSSINGFSEPGSPGSPRYGFVRLTGIQEAQAFGGCEKKYGEGIITVSGPDTLVTMVLKC